MFSLFVRNHLWTVWLRRSPRRILTETSAFVRKACTARNVRRGLFEALAGLPWLLKERRGITPALEQEISKLS